MENPRIAYLTAGAAGMYCGSCLHDNTLAAALQRIGVDAQLLPACTPIRTDEADVTVDRIFFGGINVYLQQKSRLFRLLPRWLFRWLDGRRLLRWATSRGIETDPRMLGELTVSMLRGKTGNQRKEVDSLVHYLAHDARPHLVVLTNMLVAGFVPRLKERMPDTAVLVTLQGDDLFLDGLTEPFRGQTFAEIRRIAESVDGFLAHTQYYADYMAEYLQIDRSSIHRAPLGIDVRGFPRPVAGNDAEQPPPESLVPPEPRDSPPVIGYLARLDPPKGLHVLVDAFLQLRKRPGLTDARLKIAGWLGPTQRAYAEEQFARLRAARRRRRLRVRRRSRSRRQDRISFRFGRVFRPHHVPRSQGVVRVGSLGGRRAGGAARARGVSRVGGGPGRRATGSTRRPGPPGRRAGRIAARPGDPARAGAKGACRNPRTIQRRRNGPRDVRGVPAILTVIE